MSSNFGGNSNRLRGQTGQTFASGMGLENPEGFAYRLASGDVEAARGISAVEMRENGREG